MRSALAVSLLWSLWLGGCAGSRAAAPPAAPTPPPPPPRTASAPPPAAPADADDTEEADEDPQRLLQQILDDPDLSAEDKRRLIDVLQGSPAQADPSGAAAADDGSPQTPVGGDVHAPVAADLAGYLKDIPGKGPLIATIETSLGSLHCALLPDQAPMAVANFIGLATGKKPWLDPRSGTIEHRKPFYDGLIFHRVIPGFGIQGGAPLGRGSGGPGYDFADEVNNGLTMQPGTLMMANRGSNTNGSQFFITEGSPDYLNNRHTIFGRCKELDVIARIARVPTGPGDRPTTPVTITRIGFSKN